MDSNTNNDDRRIRRVDRHPRDMGAGRPYRFALFPNPDGGFVLRSPDLPGRGTAVASIDEVGSALRIAVEVPRQDDATDEDGDGQYSGKFVLRLPRTLHRQLAELAVEEGVSLNQLALSFLAEGMGRMNAAQDFGDRRGGPRGNRRGHRGHGPERGGPQGEHGPERRGPGRADLRGTGRDGHDEGGGNDARFGGRRGGGHGRGHGPRHGRPGFTGTDRQARLVDPEIPRLV